MRTTDLLIAATYAMACATVAGLAGIVLRLPVSTGLVLALGLILICVQIHSMSARRRERKATAREIAAVRRAGKAIERALSDTDARLAEMDRTIAAREDAQNEKIVSELKMLEGLMREFAGRISQRAKDVPGAEERMPLNRPPIGAHAYLHSLGEAELLETIRASLEENRVDLYLQPIVSLPQRKTRYYEALSRLRAEDGSVIMPAQYMKIASPAGLMSVVDNLLLFRCVQIVRKLTQKNREVGIFCNISGDTLNDREFFPQFLDYMAQNRDLAGQIVFEFSQEALARGGPDGEANLANLARLGFALSLDHVETLAVDFGRLQNLGFRHVKVRAAMLTGGMADARAAVTAEDFKGLLARFGLNLIAERVEDEKTVLQLLDYAVDFGQGFLFGEPRAVRDEALVAVPKPESIDAPLRRSA